jgi:hypothetical protein
VEFQGMTEEYPRSKGYHHAQVAGGCLAHALGPHLVAYRAGSNWRPTWSRS